MDSYSIRIVNLDSCMCTPIQGLDVTYSEFRGASVNQVPILRLFGSTSTGEKICVHIHGVFPYIYIPYDGNQEPNSLMYKIAASIDKAVNISLNQASSNAQHVYKISLVKGIPMYGYHTKEHQFFKIYLYNPLLIRKVTSILMNETTLGQLYQPHEAHLNFTLQFMIDFNLHGMSDMVLSKMMFRLDSNNPSSNIDPELFLPPTVSKMTVCELEGDCLAENIVNREEVASGIIAANPGIAALWEDERQRRRNKGENSQVEHLLELKRTDVEPTKSHFLYKRILAERLAVLSTERNIVNKMNASVYPAETPDDAMLRNASMIDSQTPSSLELSLNSTSVSCDDLDETIKMSQDIDANLTLDQEAMQLLELLNELGENAKESVGEDSILTQVANEDDEEKDLDLSMPLEAATTPKKIVPPKDDSEGSDDDLWNTTLIPQLDGESEEVLKNFKIDEYFSHTEKIRYTNKNKNYVNKPGKRRDPSSGIPIKKAVFIKIKTSAIGKDMPDLEGDWQNFDETEPENKSNRPKKIVRFKRPLVTVFGKSKLKRKKPTRKELEERAERKTQEEVKRLGNRISKLNRQDQIIMIMRKLHKKENKIVLWLNATGVPKFRVLSKDEVLAPYPLREPENEKKFSKVKIISDIIVKIANFVDPSLHINIKYPNHCCYLYNYDKKIIPDVIRIPRKVCQSKCREDINTFNKNNIKKVDVVEEVKCEENHELVFVEDVTDAVSYSDYKSDEKSSIYIFSDKYLSDVKDLSVVQNIKNQTDEQLRQTAESLRKKLEQHIRLLHLPLNVCHNNNNNTCDDERNSLVDKIKCLEIKQVFDEKFPEEFFDGTERDSFENTKPKNNFNSTNIKEKTATPRKKPGYFPRNMRNDENFGGELRKSLRINCPEYKLRLERFKEIKNNLDLSVRDMEYLKNLLKSEQNLELRKSGELKRCYFCVDGTMDSSSDDEQMQRSDSMTKEDGRKRKISGPTQSLKKSQRIRAKQNHDFIVTLDGTVDSSSSDEEKMGAKCKRTARTPSRDSQRYRALPISINKSPKTEGLPKSSDKCGVSLNTHNLLKEETPMTQKATVNTVCDLNVKRQLFSNDSCLNSTIVEEKIVCSYAPVHRKIDILKDISNENCFEGKPGSGTIFSSDSDSNCDQEFLTAAEKYDKETDYLAKEGSSRYLTQELSGTTPRDAYPSSGNSSSGQITPYQRFGSANMYAIPEESPNEGTGTDTFPKVGHLATNRAPTRRDVIISLDKYGIALVEQKQPFYSNLEDVTGSIEVGFNVLKINSTTTEHMAEFESQTDALNNFRKTSLDDMSLQWKTTNIKNVILSFCKDRECIITPVRKPPTSKMILQWTKENTRRNVKEEKPIERVKIHLPSSPRSKEEDFEMSLTLTPCSPGSQSSSSQNTLQNTPKSSKTSGESDSPIFDKQCKARKKEILEKSFRKSLFRSQESSISHSCQITGVTENNSFDKSAQNLQNARAVLEHRNLTVLVLEVHVRTRGDFKPDPSHDSIRAVFYSILHDIPEPNLKGNKCNGVIAINELPPSPGVTKVPILNGLGFDCDVTYVDSEENLFDGFLKIIAYWDPDIFAGYEIELLSWGYLIERASILGINMKPLIGRTKINSLRWKDEDSPNELKITGRIVLDVWRLMRHEIALQSYTFESIVFHILHKRVPYYSFRELSFWWDHRSNLYRHRTVLYYLTRGMAVLELFDKLDFLGRTSELARLFGIQFYEVLSRGTQFRVESMMLRLAKPLNFIPVSPSVQQRASMKAPEYIALVLEPESKLYNDPVIVLDFQSLYPSIIIAYNYCFTTCIGKVQNLGKSGPFEFGATQLKISRKTLRKLIERDLLNFAPCGVGFVKKEVRDGIMPRMLREILDARLMVKNSMKENKEDKVLQKVLHSRQLGLKLIANVTYGYTAANFSGRMPSVEVGDSVVSKGRETLQRAIEMVENTAEWGAKVVYGDTDSLFVMVPGKSREHAFEVGKQIADAVTKANPDPIKLKLEKVYQPCILQTKKRYVGYMYENPNQKEPIYEAKGIETVRRDGCPAVSKMLEKCLRLLFETKDLSLIKKYVLKQFSKIISGRASIQDLTFAKEYRGAAGYRPGACVPALELTRKWTAVDKRNEPRSGQRVPYIIVNGPPGLPLIRLVRSPRDLLNDSSLRPNAMYYITRVIIPPINRCFGLIGADLHIWFNQMPRKVTQYLNSSVSPKKKSTISQYFSTTTCASCGDQTQLGICQNCCNSPQTTVITLMEKMRTWQRNYQYLNLVCQSCTSSQMDIKCVSLDCPVLYRRIQTDRDVQQVTYVRQLLSSSEPFL